MEGEQGNAAVAVDASQAGPVNPEAQPANVEQPNAAAGEQPAGEAAAQAGAETPNEESEEQKKRRGGWQRQRDKAREEATRARQEAEYWRNEALKTRQGQPEPAKSDDTPLAEPDINAYENITDYNRDVAKWMREEAARVARQAYKTERERETQAEKQQREQTEERELQVKLDQRYEKALAKYPDFEEKYEDMVQAVSPYGGKPGALAIRDALLHEDPDGHLEYYLGTHTAEAVRIAQLSHVGAALALGKIFAGLGQPNPAAPAAPASSQAPSPPNPTRRVSASTKAFDPLDPNTWTDQADYERKMAAYDKARPKD